MPAESTSPNCRRADIDDLPRLCELWKQAGLPVAALEKRLTSFQVIERPGTGIYGALGVQVEGVNGIIDTPVLPKDAPDAAAQALFVRALQLCRNRGVCRLWVHINAGFAGTAWPVVLRENGFAGLDEKLAARLPKLLAGSLPENVLSLKLREETASGLSLDQEFELFTRAQRDDSDRVMRAAKVFKVIAWLAALVALALAGLLLYYVVKAGAGRR